MQQHTPAQYTTFKYLMNTSDSSRAQRGNSFLSYAEKYFLLQLQAHQYYL